ncbi:hypothetical protein, partial [Lentibacter algarum]|uniref:hypothetical protein n=1 Tax=Lentibacter algarum TaxID=576131 RepID=UPI002356C521
HHMRRLLVFLPMLAACPAPEPVDLGQLTEPSIELLYPPLGEQLIRKADGSIDFLVVVDIDDMVFDKDLAGTAPAFGTGHYHVWLENTHIGSPEDLSFDVVHLAGDDPSLQSASEVHVRVSLQHNDHSDYDSNEDGSELTAWEAIIAYDIVDE